MHKTKSIDREKYLISTGAWTDFLNNQNNKNKKKTKQKIPASDQTPKIVL